jgi:hypothetical protein
VAAEQSEESIVVFLFVFITNQLFRFSEIVGGQLALYAYKFFYKGLILFIELVVAFRHRTRYDKWCTGIIDEHGVNLVDNGVVVCALHQFSRVGRHVVTQVVETELVVGSECDVCLIGFATCFRVWLMFINTVYAESVEHIERSHPFGVTFCQIVVNGDHVYAVACKGVEEYWECSYKCFTLTSCHLRNFTLMQNDTAEELYIVVDHVPFDFTTTGNPVVDVDGFVAFNTYEIVCSSQLTVKIISGNYGLFVLCEAAGCIFHDVECYWHNLIECPFIAFKYIFL